MDEIVNEIIRETAIGRIYGCAKIDMCTAFIKNQSGCLLQYVFDALCGFL